MQIRDAPITLDKLIYCLPERVRTLRPRLAV